MVERSQSAKAIQILRLKQVSECTGLSRSTIYDKMNDASPRFDPSFPKQVKLGLKSVGWSEAKIQEWLECRVNDQSAADELPSSKSKIVKSEMSNSGSDIEKRDVLTKVVIRKERVDSRDEISVDTIPSSAEIDANSAMFLDRKRTVILREFLEKQAKKGSPVSYEKVMGMVMFSIGDPDARRTIDTILENISRSSFVESEILLGVLVHEKGGRRSCPGGAFFDLVKSLGYTYEDPHEFVDQQIRRMFEYYEEPAEKSRGPLKWIEVCGVSKLHRTTLRTGE